MNKRDKYKSYFILALMGIYVLVTIMYFTLIDVHNLDKAYKKSQEDLATLTIKTIEYKMLLAENEELLRIQSDLKRFYPSNRKFVLACAWDETRWRYDYSNGIGQIKKIWYKELKAHNINPQ